MSSNINVSLDNPYGQVTIPRAKLRPSDGGSTVIANPTALCSNDTSYTISSSAHKESYMVKEDEGVEEEKRGCCYRCRRKK
uniref:Uncharacterized protein n=1 Tax=Oryzias latipes TaxID=8090 RepID=A0A3P9LCL3_ORYLA